MPTLKESKAFYTMLAKSAVLSFVAAAFAFGSADAFAVSPSAIQSKGSSFTAASCARPVQVSRLLQLVKMLTAPCVV